MCTRPIPILFLLWFAVLWNQQTGTNIYCGPFATLQETIETYMASKKSSTSSASKDSPDEDDVDDNSADDDDDDEDESKKKEGFEEFKQWLDAITPTTLATPPASKPSPPSCPGPDALESILVVLYDYCILLVEVDIIFHQYNATKLIHMGSSILALSIPASVKVQRGQSVSKNSRSRLL